MGQKALVTNKKYQGKYVAFSSIDSRKVIASGINPGTVINQARKQGASEPVIVFVPKEDMSYVY